MVKIGERYFEVKIIRKNNKNIYLRVKGDVLEVTCPRNIARDDVLRFINQKADWIDKTVLKREVRQETSKLVIDSGIYYKGKKYPLNVLKGNASLKIDKDSITIHCRSGEMEDAIKVFYKESKKEILADIYRLQDKYLKILKDYGYNEVPDYKIKLLKSMWGVNYTKKNLVVINERLIHFEDRCLEAVLWHELLHFIVPNHSKRFHEVLEYHMSDYKKIIKSIY
ncbi:MAG: DUF45 domain-containing protein [Erysipelotrichaceae bacterium]|nr:DUF45 domain-containing protein [Erysipelotrichaceae bacterium]